MLKIIRRHKATKLKNQLDKVRAELDICCKCLVVVGSNTPFKIHYEHQKVILEMKEVIIMDKLRKLVEA